MRRSQSFVLGFRCSCVYSLACERRRRLRSSRRVRSVRARPGRAKSNTQRRGRLDGRETYELEDRTVYRYQNSYGRRTRHDRPEWLTLESVDSQNCSYLSDSISDGGSGAEGSGVCCLRMHRRIHLSASAGCERTPLASRFRGCRAATVVLQQGSELAPRQDSITPLLCTRPATSIPQPGGGVDTGQWQAEGRADQPPCTDAIV